MRSENEGNEALQSSAKCKNKYSHNSAFPILLYSMKSVKFIKVKFTLQQAIKTQRVGVGIALLFLWPRL